MPLQRSTRAVQNSLSNRFSFSTRVVRFRWISICPGGDLKKDLEIFFKKNGFKEESSRLEGIRHITGSFLGKPLNFAHFEQGWVSIEGCHDAEWVRSRLHKQVEILPQGSAALFLKKNAISN
jgi:hypothetical protein